MPRRPHDSLAARLDALPPEERPAALGELESLRIDLERRRRDVERGDLAAAFGDLPPFIAAVEAEAPGAARLYYAMPSPCAPDAAVPLGARLGMDRAAVASALDALRRAELVLDGPDGYTATAPGSQPF